MVNKRRIISRNVIKKCIGKIGQASLVTLGDFDEIVKRDARISWVSGNVNDLKLKSKFHAEHTNLNAIMSDFLKRSLIQLILCNFQIVGPYSPFTDMLKNFG